MIDVEREINLPVHGYIIKRDEETTIRINASDPKWRQRVALSHELWHLMDYTYDLGLDHEEVHLLAIWSAMRAKHGIGYDTYRLLFKKSLPPKEVVNDHARLYKSMVSKIIR